MNKPSSLRALPLARRSNPLRGGYRTLIKFISCLVVVAFTLTTVLPPSYAQELISPSSRFETTDLSQTDTSPGFLLHRRMAASVLTRLLLFGVAGLLSILAVTWWVTRPAALSSEMQAQLTIARNTYMPNEKRYNAIKALGRGGPAEAAALAAIYADKKMGSAARISALLALGNMGKTAIPAFRSISHIIDESTHEGRTEEMIGAIEKRGDSQQPLVAPQRPQQQIPPQDETVKDEVRETVRRMAAEDDVLETVRRMASRDAQTRAMAYSSFMNLPAQAKTQPVVNSLGLLLKNPNEKSRQLALSCLQRVISETGRNFITPKIIDALKQIAETDPSAAVKSTARSILTSDLNEDLPEQGKDQGMRMSPRRQSGFALSAVPLILGLGALTMGHWMISGGILAGLVIAGLVIKSKLKKKAVLRDLKKILEDLKGAKNKEAILNQLTRLEELAHKHSGMLSYRKGKAGLTPEKIRSIKKAATDGMPKPEILKMVASIELRHKTHGHIKQILEETLQEFTSPKPVKPLEAFTPAQLQADPLLPITTDKKEKASFTLLGAIGFIIGVTTVASVFLIALFSTLDLLLSNRLLPISSVLTIANYTEHFRDHPIRYLVITLFFLWGAVYALLKSPRIKTEKVIDIDGIPFSFDQSYLILEDHYMDTKNALINTRKVDHPSIDTLNSLIQEYNTLKKAAVILKLFETACQGEVPGEIQNSILSCIKANLNNERPEVQLHMELLLAHLLGAAKLTGQSLPQELIDENLIQHASAVLLLSMMLFEEDKVVKKIASIANKPELTAYTFKKVLIKEVLKLINDRTEPLHVRNTAALILGLTAEEKAVSYELFGKETVLALKVLEKDNAAIRNTSMDVSVYFAVHQIALLYVKHLQEPPSTPIPATRHEGAATFQAKPLKAPAATTRRSG